MRTFPVVSADFVDARYAVVPLGKKRGQASTTAHHTRDIQCRRACVGKRLTCLPRHGMLRRGDERPRCESDAAAARPCLYVCSMAGVPARDRPHRRATAGVGRARDGAAAPDAANPGGAHRCPTVVQVGGRTCGGEWEGHTAGGEA